MDVTSLLNAGTNPMIRRDSTPASSTISITDASTIASTSLPTPEQSPDKTSPSPRRMSGSRTPSRNRTPWDADGYSLPLTIETKFPPISGQTIFYGSDRSSPIENIQSAGGISPYGSVPTHSRTASMASSGSDMGPPASATPLTTQSRPTFPGGETESHLLEISTARRASLGGESDAQLTARRSNFVREHDVEIAGGSPKSPKHKFSDSYSSLSSYTSSAKSQCHSRFSSMSTQSGNVPRLGELHEKMESQASIVYPPMGDLRLTSPRQLPPHSANISPATATPRRATDSERPQSPSDAILFMKGISSNRSSPEDGSSTTHLKSDLNYLHLPTDHFHAKSHKRAVSAPDFAALTAPSAFQPFAAVSENSAYAPPNFAMSSPPESPPPAATSTEVKCMYIDNCDTGSQPRKAISHIFGRNKLCTRMIPNHVWVQFCRKHYQRSRYRNAHEYSKLQVELVQKQIDRVQQWSDENERAGKQGIVNNWSLSVRKREAKRLEDKKDGSKKRAYDSEEENEFDQAKANGTAVPRWLLDKCGSGYSTSQVQEIVALLKTAIDSNELQQIPDIEILPNISGEGGEEHKPKTYVKRKPAINTHKRSQSMGVALRPDTLPMDRRVSQPNVWTSGEFDASPAEKRQRLDDLDAGDHYGRPPPMSLPALARSNERPAILGVRRIHPLAHRPPFGDIREHHPEDNYFVERPTQLAPPFVFNSTSASSGPLPAPSPQRRDSNPLGSRLEVITSGMHSFNRPAHQRSHSEVGSFASHTSASGFRPSSSSGYGAPPAPYPYGHTEPSSYEPTYPPRHETGFATGVPPSHYDDEAIHPRNFSEAVQPRTHSQSHASFHAAGPSPSPSRLGLPLSSGPRHARHQSTPNAGRMMLHMPTTQGYPPPLPAVSGIRHQYDRSVSSEQTLPHASYAPQPPTQKHSSIMEDESAKNLFAARR